MSATAWIELSVTIGGLIFTAAGFFYVFKREMQESLKEIKQAVLENTNTQKKVVAVLDKVSVSQDRFLEALARYEDRAVEHHKEATEQHKDLFNLMRETAKEDLGLQRGNHREHLASHGDIQRELATLSGKLGKA